MAGIPKKNGHPCWPCIVGGMSMMVVIVGVVYLVLDYLF
jgi:hypothetical protein